MIRAELKDGMIFLSADRESAIYIQHIRGAFRTSRMPPLTWALPLSFDAIDDLRREKVLVSPELAQKARSMLAALDKIVIDPERCPKAAEEFSLYEYERNAQNEYVNGFPDRDNHAIDAVRYALSLIWRRKGE